MDYIVINNRWKNAIKNVDTSYIHSVDTDHKLVIASVKFQLKANPPKVNTSKMMKLRKPDNIHLNHFNAAVASQALQEIQNTDGADLTFDQLNAILLQSAMDYLLIQPPEQKKEYISQRTWALLDQKWQAIENQQSDVAESNSKYITAETKKDEENHLLEELEAVTAQGYKWSGLKRLRAKFTPKCTKFKNKDGTYIHQAGYPPKAAEYLSTIQWGGSFRQLHSHLSRLERTFHCKMVHMSWMNPLSPLMNLIMYVDELNT